MVDANLTIDGSTISGNSAGFPVGPVISTPQAGGGGGGFTHGQINFTVNISNSTISGNRAATRGGGLFNDGDVLNLTHVTITREHRR